jgi:flagellar basal-body rod protein FlgC
MTRSSTAATQKMPLIVHTQGDFMDIYDITASSMTAQRLRMDTVAANLANVNTTRRPDGTIGAYRRKNITFAPMLNAQQAAQGDLQMTDKGVVNGMNPQGQGNAMGGGVGVQVLQITEDNSTPMRMVYEPSHPDANAEGFVEYPNVNAVTEMVDMISASRAYEASVSAFQSTKSMSDATLNM